VRKSAAFVVAGLLAAPYGATETEVRRTGDKVDLRATAAPLSEVLDRLARQTGMKVSYDGPPPHGRISVTLTGVTPAEAVLAVLQGQGLNYALRMDRTATQIETLLLVAAGSSPAVASAPVRPNLAPRAIEREPEPEPQEAEEEAPSEAPVPQIEDRRPGRFPGFPGSPSGPAVPLVLPTPPPAGPPAPVAPSPAQQNPQD
jgi:hypothetical protein